MNLKFDYYNNLEEVELYLCNPDGKELFTIIGQERQLTLRFNDLSELTFSVSAKVTLPDCSVEEDVAYDYIQTRRLIYATNIGWFVITNVDEHDDGVAKYKKVTTESLQAVFKDKGVLTEERVYCFYNSADPFDNSYDSFDVSAVPSVIGQLSKQLGIKQDLQDSPGDPDEPYQDWTVTYVDPRLVYTPGAATNGLCRSFKETTVTGYDWIVNDVEDAFEVVVLFDFLNKAIQVMFPEDVATMADVIYSFNNFMKDIDVKESADDIVTVLSCNGGGGLNITGVNPTGTNYICDFSYYMDSDNYKWMSADLINLINQWKSEYDDAIESGEYSDLVQQLQEKYTQITTTEKAIQEASLRLTDIQEAMSRRENLDKSGRLLGTIMVERVPVGSRGLKGSSDFTGQTMVVAYPNPPTYNDQQHRWAWTPGNTYGNPADVIINYNFSLPVDRKHYLYAPIDGDGYSSYCVLESATRIDPNTGEESHYCSGYKRYIAYVAPTASGSTRTYVDKLSEWSTLWTTFVRNKQIELCGFALESTDKFKTNPSTGQTIIEHADGTTSTPSSTSTYGIVNALVASINNIASSLNIISYVSQNAPSGEAESLLRELNCYWIEGEYTNDNLEPQDDTTLEEEFELAEELLAAGQNELSKVSQPRFSFSLNSLNVLRQHEFKSQMNQLELGKIITIEKADGLYYYPALLEITVGLDSFDDFSMKFANATRLDDWGYTYADLISKASSTSKTVSANWKDIFAYSSDRDRVNSIIQDPLNATLRAATANAANQEFVTNSSGILGRKRRSDGGSDEGVFEPEQVRLINNVLLFTDDNWETAKAALGKIYYDVVEEDGSTTTESTYGLVADTIVGNLIIAEDMRISNDENTITLDENGISISDGTEWAYKYTLSTNPAMFPDGKVVYFSPDAGDKTKNGGYYYFSLKGHTLSVADTGVFDTIDNTITFGGSGGSSFSVPVLYTTTSTAVDVYAAVTVSAEKYEFPASHISCEEILSPIVFRADPSGNLFLKGEIQADIGAVGGLKIDNGIKGFDGATDDETFSLTANGLTLADSSAKVRAGGLEIGHDSGQALIKSTGPICIRGVNGSEVLGAIEIMPSRQGAASTSYSPVLLVTPRGGIGASPGTFGVQLKMGNPLVLPVTYTIQYEIFGGILGIGKGSRSFDIRVESGQQESEKLWIDIDALDTKVRFKCCRHGYGDSDVVNWSGKISLDASSEIRLGSFTQTTASEGVHFVGNLVPKATKSYSLGAPNNLWNVVYAASSSINTSDKNEKNTIAALAGEYTCLFDSLKPVSYKFNDGTSDRTHVGFIAQDVKEAVVDAGLTTKEFAGYCEWEKEDGTTGCGLRYEEFIAMCVAEIQALKKRVAELESERVNN